MHQRSFKRTRRGKPFRPSAAKRRVARKIEKKDKGKKKTGKGKKGKGPKLKARRDALGQAMLEKLRGFEREIIQARGQGKSAETICNEIREKHEALFHPRSILLFFKVLEKEKKLTASGRQPVKRKPSERGPLESTRLKLDPYRQFIIDSYRKGGKQSEIILWLRRRGVNVSQPTLKKYYLWAVKQKRKRSK
jgi:hypothetical protein